MSWMVRFFGVLVLGALCACKSTAVVDASQPPLQLEWSFASDTPQKGFTEMADRAGANVWVNPNPILRLTDISNAARSTSGDTFLYLNVKLAARSGLQADTGTHIKQLLALRLKGNIVYVATLQSSLSRQVPVRIGVGGITESEADEILAAVKRSGGGK